MSKDLFETFKEQIANDPYAKVGGFALRQFAVPQQFVSNALQRPPKEALEQTAKYAAFGEEYETPPPPWLPGNEFMKNMYTDPFMLLGGVNVVKNVGKKALKSAPKIFKKAVE